VQFPTLYLDVHVWIQTEHRFTVLIHLSHYLSGLICWMATHMWCHYLSWIWSSQYQCGRPIRPKKNSNAEYHTSTRSRSSIKEKSSKTKFL